VRAVVVLLVCPAAARQHHPPSGDDERGAPRFAARLLWQFLSVAADEGFQRGSKKGGSRSNQCSLNPPLITCFVSLTARGQK
jgi:hypothetical protein